MISANQAKANSLNAINDIRKYPEFKYAMNKLEKEIISASKDGKCEIRYNLCALCEKNGDFPSKALREAIAEELYANGYSYYEYQQMNIGGEFNSCFRVSW